MLIIDNHRWNYKNYEVLVKNIDVLLSWQPVAVSPHAGRELTAALQWLQPATCQAKTTTKTSISYFTNTENDWSQWQEVEIITGNRKFWLSSTPYSEIQLEYLTTVLQYSTCRELAASLRYEALRHEYMQLNWVSKVTAYWFGKICRGIHTGSGTWLRYLLRWICMLLRSGTGSCNIAVESSCSHSAHLREIATEMKQSVFGTA